MGEGSVLNGTPQGGPRGVASGSRPAVHVRGQKGSGMGGHQRGYRGNSIEWYTPPGIIEALGLDYDLDPCSPCGGLAWIPAKRTFSTEDDGLSQPWSGRVWLNPPYGPRTADWMRRLAAHGSGIALVFARTETEWWQQTVRCAHAVCFIAGRLTFVDEDRMPGSFNAGAPSALVGYGQDCAEAIARAKLGMTFAVRASNLGGQASLWESPEPHHKAPLAGALNTDPRSSPLAGAHSPKPESAPTQPEERETP